MESIKYPFKLQKHGITTVAVTGLFFAMGIMPVLFAIASGNHNVWLPLIFYLLVVFLLGWYWGLSNIESALLILMIILTWQPVLSMPLSWNLNQTGVRMLVATKEVYVIALLAALFFRNWKKVRWNYVDASAIFFLFIYFVYWIRSPIGWESSLFSFREGFMIFAFYMVGRLTLFNWYDIHWVLKCIVIVALFATIFGYVERFFFSEAFWLKIGAMAYFKTKLTMELKQLAYSSLPNNWLTYIDGKVVRRMVSSIGEPTSFSRFLSFPILTLIYVRLFRSPKMIFLKLLLLLLLSGALILSFGRGGILIVLGGAGLWTITKKPWLSVIVLPIIFVIFMQTPLLALDTGSGERHINAFQSGFNYVFSTGRGLGTAGEQAILHSNEYLEERLGESYFAALAYQTGTIGIISFFLFFCSMLWHTFNKFLRLKRKHQFAIEAEILFLNFVMLAGIFITSFLANSAVAPISVGLPLILSGMVIGITRR